MNFSIINKLRNKIKVDTTTKIVIGEKLKISGCKIIIKGKNNQLIIGDNVRLRNVIIEIIGNNCSIIIGSDSMIGKDSYISAKEENITLKIGERCGLSRNVKIMTSDGHPIFQDGVRINNAKNITIENDVWIADSVTILKGVIIGSGSVVGINSMVLRDIPQNVVAAGSPCRAIKEGIVWRDSLK